MYCAECGCKIHAGENECSNCGNKIENIEYCGGFWGLVENFENKEEKLEDNQSECIIDETVDNRNEVYNDENNFQIEKCVREGSHEKRKNIFKIILVVALMVCAVQSVQKMYINQKYERLKKYYSSSITENYELQKIIEEIESENEELKLLLEKYEKNYR